MATEPPVITTFRASERRVAPLILALTLVVGITGIVGLVIHPFLLAIVGCLVGPLIRKTVREHPGELAIDDATIAFDDKPVMTRANVRTAYVAPAGRERAALYLEPSSGKRRRFVLGSIDEGRAALSALGMLGAERRVVFVLTESAPGVDFAIASAFAAAFAGFAWFGAFRAVAALVVVAVAMFFAKPWRREVRVEIGPDGLTITRAGSERFVPYRDLLGVQRYRRRFKGIALKLRGGETLALATENAGRSAGALAAGIADQIEAARARVDARRDTFDVGTLLRGQDNPRAWVERLRARGAGGADDMRTAPLDRERLWNLLEDPSRQEDVRAAAAIALGGSAQPDERARFATMATEAASHRVRIVLENATGEVDELVEALAETEREESRATRR